MNLTIHVTRELIDKGVARHCHKCPIAEAVKIATGLDYSVTVSHRGQFATAFFTNGRESARTVLPDQCYDFILIFDMVPRLRCVPEIKPFSFEAEFELVSAAKCFDV